MHFESVGDGSGGRNFECNGGKERAFKKNTHRADPGPCLIIFLMSTLCLIINQENERVEVSSPSKTSLTDLFY